MKKKKVSRRNCIVIIAVVVFGFFYACQPQGEMTENNRSRVVDKVYPLIDASHSRWLFFSSASRPFGMVNLSPDMKLDGYKN